MFNPFVPVVHPSIDLERKEKEKKISEERVNNNISIVGYIITIQVINHVMEAYNLLMTRVLL